jgi:hypothetical protein
MGTSLWTTLQHYLFPPSHLHSKLAHSWSLKTPNVSRFRCVYCLANQIDHEFPLTLLLAHDVMCNLMCDVMCDVTRRSFTNEWRHNLAVQSRY